MKISWKWLSECVDLKSVGGPNELAELLTRRGLEVEEICSQSRGFEKVVVAQILERAPHPQADRLSLCKVSVGSGDPLEIVCGAQNMKAGDKVALAQIGASLPNGLKITQSKIRGVVSNGMLCSESELGMSESSEGILILREDAVLGRPLAEILGRDDIIFTLKLTANRGDCMSHFGLAREIASALGVRPIAPSVVPLPQSVSKIQLRLDAGEACPQFFGCTIEGVKIGPSPDWMVKRLEALGSRSINNVVDATHWVMLELGHPMHAYDADLLEGNLLSVRVAKPREALPLLDGKTIELEGWELVIADAARAVGLAGVMGGGNSEVRPQTQNLFLECAEFAPVLVRRAAQKHQRRTDAAQRFEKGIDPASLHFALGRLASLIVELAGGKIKSSAVAKRPERESGAELRSEISVNPTYFAGFLGMPVESTTAESILKSLDCQITVAPQGEWRVRPPSYRWDLSLKQELAEEIARSLGYDKIPSRIPALSSSPQSLADNPSALRYAVMERAKMALGRLGLSEVLNYGFGKRSWLNSLGFESTVRVLNPLSEEHEAMVPSLIPGLIQNSLDNWHHHFGAELPALRLFELRPTFGLKPGATRPEAQGQLETQVQENWKLAFAVSGPRWAQALQADQQEVDFFDLKGVVEGLFEALGTRGVRIVPLERAETALGRILHPGQSADVWVGNQLAGQVGLLHPRTARQVKARHALWLGELDWEIVAKLSRSALESPAYRPWPEFPTMERDFALLVGEGVAADKIIQLALKAGKPIAKVAKIFDIYRGSQVAQGMTSVAVRVIFFDEGRSLQESETELATNRILEIWKKELGAELRS